MRNPILLSMLFATNVAFAEYSEPRFIAVDAEGVSELVINAGPGSLEVSGSEDADGITVDARIRFYEDDEAKAKRAIEKRVDLALQRDGDIVRLTSVVRGGLFSWGSNPSIDLNVTVPAGIRVAIDDGSGRIVVRDIVDDLMIDDGSGGIELSNVGNVKLDDGSGGIRIDRAAGDISIDDGSGGLNITNVQGSLEIEDGSGDITVENVDGDLVIIDDGSGSLSFKNIQGSVQKEDD